MPDPYNEAVRQFAAQMPSCWKPDYRIKVAQQNVAANAQHEVNNRINEFALDSMPKSLRGDQTMPAYTAAMPPSLHDNQNGNFMQGGYGNRNNRAATDQLTAQQGLDLVRQCLDGLGENQENEFLEGLADLLEAYANGPVNAPPPQTGSSLRLPIGQGTNVGAMTAPEQSTNGSFSARTEAWKDVADPPSATDRPFGVGFVRSLGRNARDRRAQAQDSARRAQNLGDFLDRFPMAARIKVW